MNNFENFCQALDARLAGGAPQEFRLEPSLGLGFVLALQAAYRAKGWDVTLFERNKNDFWLRFCRAEVVKI